MSQKTKNGFLNGIDEKGTWLAKFFAKICTYGLAYAVIYLAVQSALPQLRNGVIYSIAMIIVMGSPELMITGLASEAIEKFKENKTLGLFLFVVAGLFLSIGILTMFDIFVWHFKDASQGQQMLSLYRAVVVLLYSAVHGIVSKLDEQRAEKVQQQVQANDKLALANQKQIEDVSANVYTLADSVDKLVYRVDQLCTEQAVIAERVHKNVDMAVDTLQKFVDREEFEKLARTVNVMSSSVTEVNQNVLQITQNLYNVTPSQPLARSIEEERFVLSETAESHQIDSRSDGRNALSVPILDVPGVSSEKVQSVITAFLSGTGWRQMPGNYSRTIKPIRDAFEASQNTENTDVYTHVDM